MTVRSVARGLIAKVDPKFAEELDEKPRIVFHRLQARGFLDGFAGKRILEIGPKHGWDSALLASLGPSELTLIDLPEKVELVGSWLPSVQAVVPTRFVAGNLLYLERDALEQLGTFDLVWCLGVLYHNAEQLRLIRRLRTLCSADGKVVIETEIDGSRSSVVRVHWPEPLRGVPTVTHNPSRTAVMAWMEMAGFTDVRSEHILSRPTARKRAVLTGRAGGEPYRGYIQTGRNPEYIAGEAT